MTVSLVLLLHAIFSSDLSHQLNDVGQQVVYLLQSAGLDATLVDKAIEVGDAAVHELKRIAELEEQLARHQQQELELKAKCSELEEKITRHQQKELDRKVLAVRRGFDYQTRDTFERV